MSAYILATINIHSCGVGRKTLSHKKNAACLWRHGSDATIQKRQLIGTHENFIKTPLMKSVVENVDFFGSHTTSANPCFASIVGCVGPFQFEVMHKTLLASCNHPQIRDIRETQRSRADAHAERRRPKTPRDVQRRTR